ncbi:restriction endonuclease subunit S [Neobacillus notoginsengisoli]|uniref:Restriction endonuclease subunit S n=1 Tax=Neobacillus notoginsengisoli TaxID=1578198 RepID=A0A417YTI5_9BACI|nr:restriction endonuclease subunit S [Neobacillus notoginsengisoli]RHW40385.1 restriction endonuclease subunit S [Neobacillus notoginsengisoli]
MLLGEIADVKTGLVLSRKKAEVPFDIKAKYNLLSLKNITEDGVIQTGSYDQFESNDILDDYYFTSKGDVLIRLSQPNMAVYIDDDRSGLLIPSYFAVIKIHQPDFLPQYVAWYLNSEEVKKELERFQSGSRIPSMNQNVLRSLPIAKLPFDKQKTLVELWKLHLKEKHLYRQLLAGKEQLFKGITRDLMNGL